MTRVLSSANYRIAPLGPNSAQFARTSRPTWAVITAWLLALPSFGVSLLLLLVKNTEISSAVFDDGPAGLRVHLSGPLPNGVVETLAGALSSRGQATVPVGFPPPPSAPSTPSPYAPPSTPSAYPRLAQPDVEMTVARPAARVAAQSDATATVLAFDTGERVRAAAFGLIGRSPAAAADDPAAVLVSIDDVERTLSKTHMAFGVDGSGLWVADRFSTNGSAVTDAGGVRIACVPGQRRYVQPGWTVHIGSRAFLVTAGATVGEFSP